jgi:hypothetical protein
MPINDFTDKKWMVSESGVTECSFMDGIEIVKCKPEDPEDKGVKVTCKRRDPQKDFTYPKGIYCEPTNTIKGEDGSYEIQLQIKFAILVGTPITGSWTANDTAGGADGDG